MDSINRSVVIVDAQGNVLKCGSDYSTAINNIAYRVETDGNVTVTGVNQTTQSMNLVIPSLIEGKMVTKIAENAFKDCSNILSVKFPDSIVDIGNGAFENCVNISGIYVYNDNLLNYFDQNTVDTIGYNVTVYDASGDVYIKTQEFTNDASDYLYAKRSDGTIVIKQYLGTETEVVIPDEIDGMKVTAIGSDAFCVIHHTNCNNITSITLPSTLREIYSMAFYFIRAKEIKIPEGVTVIGDAAFAWGSLESVTFPSTLKSIGDNAFALCGLKEIVLPDGLERIGTDAFANNGNLTSIRIPASVKSMEGSYGLAFLNNPNLFEINVDADNEIYASVDGVLFSKDMKTLIFYPQAKEGSAYTIPEGITTIGENAFRTSTYYNGVGGDGVYTEGVEVIHIPASVENIASSALTANNSLKEVVVDEGNTNYASVDGVLYSKDRTTLCVYPAGKTGTTYEMLSSVVHIAENAFSQNKQLEKIVLPEKLESIGTEAFYDCMSLVSVVIYDKVSVIGDSAFDGCADSDYTDLEFTITCYPSSYAHEYANENGYSVNLLEEKKDETSSSEEPTTETTETPVTDPTTETTEDPATDPTQPPATDSTQNPAMDSTQPPVTDQTQHPVTEPQTTEILQQVIPATVNTTLTDTAKQCTVVVTSSDAANPTVAYKQTTNKKAKKVTVPDTVSIDGITYTVTSIADNAFAKNKKVTKVTVGKNVTSIGKNAFKNCSKLKTIDIKSSTLNKIGSNAFSGAKKLTKITIKSTKLTKKSIGKNALKGTNKKLVIKVPKKMVKKYKTYFKNKGNKTVKIKK